MIEQAILSNFDRVFYRREVRGRASFLFNDLRSSSRAGTFSTGEGFFFHLTRGARVATISAESSADLHRLLTRVAREFDELAVEGSAPVISARDTHLNSFGAFAPGSLTLREMFGRVKESVRQSASSVGVATLGVVGFSEYKQKYFYEGSALLASYDSFGLELNCRLDGNNQASGLKVGGAGWSCLESLPAALLSKLRAPLLKPEALPPSVDLPVLMSGQAAGVFVHECIAHPLEADHFENSWLARGQYSLPDELSVADDGTRIDMSGYCPVDDEGQLGRRTFLIRDGRVQSLMHSARTAAALGVEPTANGRALDWRYPALPRCTNTIVLPGTLTDEELFSRIPLGLYIEEVGDASGGDTFALTVRSARLIRDGSLRGAVPIASVVGETRKALAKLEGIGSDVTSQFVISAGCGKQEQSPLPVGLSAPKLQFRSLTVRR